MAAIFSWLSAAIGVFALEVILQRRLFARVKLLETRPIGYTPKDAHDILSRLGQSGRTSYAWFQAVDFGLILALTKTMLAMQQRGSPGLMGGPLRFAPILPLAYAASDVTENVALLALILTFPRCLGALSRVASRITSTKFVLVVVALAASGSIAVSGSRKP